MSVYSKTSELYTPLSTALNELAERRSNERLKSHVDSYFVSQPPPIDLAHEPKAVASPALVTPNLELQYFMDVSRQLPIKPIFLEFSKDKFVHINYTKRCLGELTFFREDDYGSKHVTNSIRIVDFVRDQGKAMNKIKTTTGENLVQLHHRITAQLYPIDITKIVDFSDWFIAAHSFDKTHPYLRFLGLFLYNGILFGNFTTEKRESAFTHTQVLPAFRKLKDIFGVRPLIVPIGPTETDDDLYWCYYPEAVRDLI